MEGNMVWTDDEGLLHGDPETDGFVDIYPENWLPKFLKKGDREEAEFFVGREAPIGAVMELCAEAMDRRGEGKGYRGITRVLQGAPGAGKTAILCELEKRWSACVEKVKKDPRGIPRPVWLSYQYLQSEAEVTWQIAKAIAIDLSHSIRPS